MSDADLSMALVGETRAAWGRYVDVLAPFRPQLFAYCRKLTGDVWDAEDLVQETMLKGFATLGARDSSVANPRGYLTRIATNLWLDALRRRESEARALAEPAEAADPPADADDVRRAGARLFERLAPQERAAVVLKDVLDLSLAEIAETLATSTGAVKAALHRGRGRLAAEAPAPTRRAASPALVDRFVDRLNAGDMPGLIALMLETASVEMLGGVAAHGRAEYEREGGWLWHAVNVHADLPPDRRPPRWINERIVFQGEAMAVGLMPGSRALQGINRFEETDGKVSRIRSYCFSPEAAAEVAEALGLAPGWIPYRFPG